MDLQYILRRMASNADAIRALADGVDDEQAHWRARKTSWSIVEIVAHLHDEEREDFRQRIDYTLHRPGDDWPPIDPEGWVTARDYQSRSIGDTLAGFLGEREKSLLWLRSLHDPVWTTRHEHPKFGGMDAGDLMSSWLVHDFLHIRQLACVHYQYAEVQTRPFSSEYAGGW